MVWASEKNLDLDHCGARKNKLNVDQYGMKTSLVDL